MFFELSIARIFRVHVRNHSCAIADPRARGSGIAIPG